MTLDEARAVSSVATGRMLGMSIHSVLARDHSIVQIWRKDNRGQLNLIHLQWFGAEPQQTFSLPIHNPGSFQSVAPMHAHCVEGQSGELTHQMTPHRVAPNKVIAQMKAKKVATTATKTAIKTAKKNAVIEANIPSLASNVQPKKSKVLAGQKRQFEDISSDEGQARKRGKGAADLLAAAAAAAQIQRYAAQQCNSSGETNSQGK